jgi:hypothetical protein
MQSLGTFKYMVFFILLKFQNLWNLIKHIYEKKFEKNYLVIFYDFQSLIGPNKWRCDVRNVTTQGWVCNYHNYTNLHSQLSISHSPPKFVAPYYWVGKMCQIVTT